MWEAAGRVNFLLKHNWYLSQTSYSRTAHERNILFGDKKAKKAPTDSNQELVALHEHFGTKLLSDYKEFHPEIFFRTTTIFARLVFKDVWGFR